MYKKVVITCDSTCDLSEELVSKYKIQVNPLYIVMNDRPMKDGIEVTPQDIYDYADATGQLAGTAAPSVGDYADFFNPILAEDCAIVHFTISASMSAAYNNARLAASQFENVYIIDSKNLSTGSGLLVLKACEMAAAGIQAPDIAAGVNRLAEHVDASFVLDTLKYMHKGGRCSAVAALGANLLKLKPCIEVKNGSMGVGKKYRGKLGDVFCSYVEDRLADKSDLDTSRIFITHSGCDDATVERVLQKVKAMADFDEIIITRAGCTISVHCGPATLGVLFIRKSTVK